MFDDYEDILTEPSEAEMIIEEAKTKLHDLIKNEAISMMEDYSTVKTQLDGLNNEIRSKKYQAERLEKKIKELEEKHEQADKYDMPKKYIDRFVRDITGNFAPGDKVWIIKYDYDWIPCDKCQGKQEITAMIDGKEHKIRCIKCDGTGKVAKSRYSIKETVISEVRLTLCFRDNRVGVWTKDSIYIKDREYAISPKEIYRSKEEAEKVLKNEENV